MKILLVEDEFKLASFIKKGFEQEGYAIEVAYDGRVAESVVKQKMFNVAILDVNLPGRNGFELCRDLKSQDNATAVIMLTALDSMDDKEEGFNAGADDYLVKPFEFKELLLRVRALSKRFSIKSESILQLGGLKLNRMTKKVSRDEKPIDLTQKEYSLLEYFMLNQDKVISRIEISENVWELNFDTQTNIIDVYVSHLRKKIDRDWNIKLLHTVVGMGYIMKLKEC
jgi:two-component system, OmpR family, copper resistance phosphate regulon response regulator CusR